MARAPEAATRSESQGPVEIGRLAAVSARPIARGALLSFRGWITGGLLGGLVAGLLIGVLYNFELFRAGQSSFGPIATEIAVYAALVGVTTSVFSRYFIVLFRYLEEQRFPPLFMFNDAFAGALGGVLGGAAVGMLGGYWFGLRHLDAVSTPLLVYGAAAGPPFVVFLIFLHDLRRLRDRAARTRTVRLVVAVIGVTYLAALLGIAFLRRFGINEEWFGRAFDDQTHLQAGAMIGVMIGGMLGAQLGLTLWLNRLMAGPTETV